MPKKVDHDDRRSAIAGVVRELVQEGGVESLTIRSVAERVGYSASVVVHYFVSKREMMIFTQMDSRRNIEAMLRNGRQDNRSILECLAAILPASDETKSYWHLFFAFWGMATYDSELATERLEAVSDAHVLFADLVERAQDAGTFDPAVDPAFAATNIQIALNGIAGLAVQDEKAWPPARQRHFLKQHLRNLGYLG